jgi:hypothetical protein
VGISLLVSFLLASEKKNCFMDLVGWLVGWLASLFVSLLVGRLAGW